MIAEAGGGRKQGRRPWMVRPSAHIWVWACAVLILLGSALRVQVLDTPVAGDYYDSRQAHTVMLVREYMRNGFDVRSPLPVFGFDSAIPLEFPLFEGVSALAANVLALGAEQATRATGLAFFQLTAMAVGILAWRWFSLPTAFISVLLFEFLPFGVQWGHAALIEFMPTFLIFGGIILLDLSNMNNPSRRAGGLGLIALVLVCIGFLVKVTTALALFPLLFVPALLATRDQSLRVRFSSLVFPSIVGMAGVLAAAVWTRWSDAIKVENRYTAYLASPALVEWNFGTFEQRLDPHTWTVILHYWVTAGGSFLGFGVIAALVWRSRPAVLALIAAPMIAVSLFTNLYLRHWYYSAAVFPAIVLLLGASIDAMETVASKRLRLGTTTVALVVLLFALSYVSALGRAVVPHFREQRAEPALAAQLREVVDGGSGVLLLECDWSPVIPYYADRAALMLPEWMLAGTSNRLGPLTPTLEDLEGFTHAAFCGLPEVGYERSLEAILPPKIVAEPTGDKAIFHLRRQG